MNCPNCGAPMTLFRERDYFFCEYCGAFHFPEPNADGVRVLDEADPAIECPVCHKSLRRASLDQYPALFCPGCRGILMQQHFFGEMVKIRRARAQGPADKPIPLNQDELKRSLSCPNCRKKMHTHPYYGGGNIVIDTCPDCRVIWLDAGELTVVVNAPGSDRGERLRLDMGDAWQQYRLGKKKKRPGF